MCGGCRASPRHVGGNGTSSREAGPDTSLPALGTILPSTLRASRAHCGRRATAGRSCTVEVLLNGGSMRGQEGSFWSIPHELFVS